MVGEDIREAQQTFTRLINSIIKNVPNAVVLDKAYKTNK
jgi:hypothetical protein